MLALLLPQSLAIRKQRVRQNQCSNNLKQVGLAFKTWSLDSRDRFPMGYEAQDGGSREAVATGKIFSHFQTMSNELTTTKVLVCPSDKRLPAKDFRTGLSNTNLSYFVGVDAEDPFPDMFLSGDRNLTNGPLPANR